jgi:RNA polymerase sigma-54 factor
MDFSLKLKQNMKLILTQDMKLSMNILEMSSSNLKELIEKEVNKNPMLEIVYSPRSNSHSTDEETTSPLDFISKEKSLFDFLEEQLSYLKLSKKFRDICYYIINNLDDRGYLSISKSDIKKIFKISTKELQEVFNIIYSLEPHGIGAENLKDCLKIQLTIKDKKDPLLFSIIDNYLEDLGDKNFEFIAENLNVSADRIKSYLSLIQTLDPIPARGYFVGNKTRYIVPDAKIEIVNKELKVTLNEEVFPKIKISSDASNKNNYQNALNLIKAIEKRYITLEKILNLLIVKQFDFFFLGKEHLKTLTLKDIASELNLHISTISRAIKEKFIETPQGIIEIKSLFIGSSETIIIKKLIEEFIHDENKYFPLSDEKISYLLKNKGFSIARRTVAKYRDELGILSTRERKIKT